MWRATCDRLWMVLFSQTDADTLKLYMLETLPYI